MKIFLIEDDAIYAEFIKKSLIQNSDYQVDSFLTAEEALTAFNKSKPDAVIIDYKLPGMSGIELYERIKSQLRDNHKVIMLSALDDGNMVLGFIQKGVRDYVIKDENVIDSLQSILAGNEDNYYFG